MLYRNSDGCMVYINKYEYTNDIEYYTKLYQCMKQRNVFHKNILFHDSKKKYTNLYDISILIRGGRAET